MKGCKHGLVAPTVSPLAGVPANNWFFIFFLFVVGRRAGFPTHMASRRLKQSKPQLTANVTQKSRRSSTTSGWRRTLELRNACPKAASPCVTLSRKQQDFDAQEPRAALCCCSNTISYTNIGQRLLEPHRKYLSVQTFPPGRRGGGKCCHWLSSRTGRLNLKEETEKGQVQISLHSWFYCHAHTRFHSLHINKYLQLHDEKKTCSSLLLKQVHMWNNKKAQPNGGDDSGDGMFWIRSFRSLGVWSVSVHAQCV